MKFEKTILDDHQARVVVEVDPDRLQAARQRAARKMAGRGKIPGFRPGKAPFDVIVRHYGEPAVQEEAVDLLVDEVYPEMLKEAEIDPAAAGLLEKVEGTDQPTFTFKVPLAPQVTLGDYGKIRVPYEFVAPGPDKLEQALRELRQAYGTTETVERTAADGDFVLLDLKSEPPGLERSDLAMLLRREERSEEFPFPGFAAQVVGLSAGATKVIHHAFDAASGVAALAGKEADLHVTVKAVRSITLPELDDGFAKTVGPYETIDALKEALQKENEARAKAEYEDEYYTKLVDTIREASTVKYAAQTLEHEAEHVIEDMRRRLAQQGLDLETYYKLRNTDAKKFLEEEAMPIAKRRLERSLILDEVAKQEKIEVDNAALDQEFNSTVLDLQTQGVNFNAIRGGKQGQQRVAEALAMQSANRLLTRKTLERLKAIATGDRTELGSKATDELPQGKTEAAAPSKAPKPVRKPAAKPKKIAGKK